MNLKNKFSIAVISLAAFIQAQDLQNQIPTGEEDLLSEIAPQGDPAESIDPPAEIAPEENVSEAPAAPALAEKDTTTQAEPVAEVSQETAPAEVTEAPAAGDSEAEPAADQTAETQPAIDSTSTENIETPAVAETSPEPNAAKTKSKKNKHKKDIKKHNPAAVHGSAYNIVNNEAADATVRSNMAMPHKMTGSRYGYFEPVDGYGIAAFGSNKRTYFLAFDNSDNLGLITAGAAFGNFGASLRFAVGKNWYKAYLEDIGDYQENNTTSSGTLFGATVSTRILGTDLGVDLAYSNTDNQQFTSSNLASEGLYSWDFTGKLTLANSYYQLFYWSASISFQRYQATRTSREVIYSVPFGSPVIQSTLRTVVTDTASHVTITPQFNIGSNVLSSPKSKLYIGLNTAIPMTAYDRISGIVSRHNEYSLQFTPNILGEVELGKYVMAFGSASYLWTAYEMRDSYKGSTGIKAYNSVSGTTTANIGMKIHMEYAALELALTNEFISNPFSSFGSVDDIGFSIGAFINFP